MGLKVVILAAGKGKRMVSNLPKVLHTIGGKSMLDHVVDTANSIDAEEVFVVHDGELISGEHVFLFKTENVKNGQYFLNFKSQYQSISKKMIIKN